MNRRLTLITTTLFATALTGAALAGGDKHAKDKVSFNKLDTDSNGVVSMSELNTASDNPATDLLTEKWPNLDTNQDGNLDRAEFARFEPIMNADEKAKQHAEEHSATDSDDDY